MKNLVGQVISAKMQKVATVIIEQSYQHPLYGKILKRNFKIHAVNKIGAGVGDQVIITEIRPVAKTVNFIIKEILTKDSRKTEAPVKTAEKPKKVKKQTKKTIKK